MVVSQSTLLDFPDTPSLPSSPLSSGRQSPMDQRQNILNLVELLLKQNDIETGARSQVSSFDDEDTTVDEHIQVAGAEVFFSLQRRINSLDKELRNFANAARQLGSSVAILASAYHLRERLAQLLFLYQENAAKLFPQKVNHVPKDSISDSPTSRRRRGLRQVKGKAQLHVPRPTVSENLSLRDFPEQLGNLADDVTNFLRCLNEFPEFTDEVVNASIMNFEGDLRYWASCLKEYDGNFHSPAVQRYIHDLSADMGEHLGELSSSLSMFIEVGVPTIRFAQEHGANNLLNLSTVATFFSAVTATTMQFSYDLPRNRVSDAVNALWFASMVFSIAASVNSLLGLTWKQAMYRSPGHRVPWWVLIWIKRSPLVFLVLSVACFSLGFTCFTYASGQSHVTSTLTTVLTAFTSFGLAAVSAWFASERWAFARHKGQKWLSDVLSDFYDHLMANPLLSGSTTLVLAVLRLVQFLCAFVGRLFKAVSKRGRRRLTKKSQQQENDPENGGRAGNTAADIGDEDKRPLQRRASDATTATKMSEPPLSLLQIPIVPHPNPASPEPVHRSDTDVSMLSTAPPVGQRLWGTLKKGIRERNAMSGEKSLTPFLSGPVAAFSQPILDSPQSSLPFGGNGNDELSKPFRKRTTSSGPGKNVPERRRTGDLPVSARSKIGVMISKLAELGVKYDLSPHSALVRHMQFSPDGKLLATAGWDKTSVVFRVGSSFTSHRILAHAQGFVGQVAWSPSGKTLLTKMPRGIKVWTAEDGVCKKTILRDAAVEAIAWCPNGESFLSIEEFCVCKLDLTGKVLDQYDLPDMKLYKVAVTPDSVRFIGVGPLLRSKAGLQPSKSRGEKRIIVYNMETKQLENRTPVLEDARDIAIAQTTKLGVIALISYEHKAPPQLWRVTKDRDNSVTLSLRRTYIPKVPVDFTGASYFGGKNNELVLSFAKAGDIYIWDQDSGTLLHVIRGHSHGADITCIAWNPVAEDPYMFAAGSHDGTVRVWTRVHPEDHTDHISEGTIPTRAFLPGFTRSASPYGMDPGSSASLPSLDDPRSLLVGDG